MGGSAQSQVDDTFTARTQLFFFFLPLSLAKANKKAIFHGGEFFLRVCARFFPEECRIGRRLKGG